MIASNSITLEELAARYAAWAEPYYRKPSGRQTGEAVNVHHALAGLLYLHGTLNVNLFSPAHLRKVQDHLAANGLARTTINARIRRIRRVIKWAVAEGFADASVLVRLQCVRPLQRGRCTAREPQPIGCVDELVVKATADVMREPLRSMVWLLWWTGMRAGELVRMRICEIDRSGDDWLYRPAEHKTEHHGKERVIALGPRAKAILEPWLNRRVDPFLFPGVEIERFVFTNRNGTPWNVGTFRQSITRATRRASVPHWSPLALRHTTATRLRRLSDLDTARAVLGHSKTSTTEIYAEVDLQRSIDCMKLLG